MEYILNMYQRKNWLEPFLIYSIYILLLVTVILFITLLVVRYNKIKKDKLKIKHDILIEEMLLNILFSTGNFSKYLNDLRYAPLFKNKFFREQLMASVINLHINYEGLYAKRLEAFYHESHLITDSFRKLKDSRWEINCQAIEELSEMNVTTVFEHLVDSSKSPNITLKIAAIKGCIKLNGTKGLTHLVRHKDPLDQWTQLTIIHALKQGDIEHTEGIDLLLFSKNSSVVSLGLKIIQTLQLSQYSVDILRMMNQTENKVLKHEAHSVISKIKINTTVTL
ncbi:MAG TPA: HEAT repeat domain-containing protein [Anditalea sp.]|nr:HEAT repeat domain-containing protein [Anditalea sp.]